MPQRGRDFTPTARGPAGNGRLAGQNGGRGRVDPFGYGRGLSREPVVSRANGRPGLNRLPPPARVVSFPRHPRPPVVIVTRGPVIPIRPPRRRPAPPSGFAGAPAPSGPTPPVLVQGVGAPPPSAPPGAGLPVNPAFTPPGVAERRYVPNEILVTTTTRISPARLQLFERRLGFTPLAAAHINLLDVDLRRYRVSDTASVRGSILALQGNPDIQLAEPNFVFELQDDAKGRQVSAAKTELSDKPAPLVTSALEPSKPVQYAIDAMKLDGAHKIATGAGVLIAIIDTGVDETHPDIAGRVADRLDAVGGTFRPLSHGTAMAGVIVAHKSLTGIAPDARLLAIRAFESLATGSGQGTSYDILRGLDFAADHKAQIVNMSFAGPHDPLLAQALTKAREEGMIEIAAAGNAGPGAEPLYPGAEPGVIAITATDPRNKIFAMANRGAYIAVAAPGVDILAPGTGGAMQLTSGTSVAAAEASGVVALLLEGHPKTGAAVVRKVLGDTAARFPAEGAAPTELIDALAAVRALSQSTSR